MALELKQSLGLSQQLVMTPQLQQAIKLLQLSRLELLDAIYQELEVNPVLEEQLGTDPEEEVGPREDTETPVVEEVPAVTEVRVEERAREDVDWESYVSEYNTGWAEAPYEERDTPSYESMTATKTDLGDHLTWQLNMSRMDEDARTIAAYIIGNLDEDGYLDIGLEEIAEATGYPLEKVEETLSLVQNFDPVGVAARDMRESLLIQARFHGLGGSLVETLIRDHLRDLENKRYEEIARRLGVTVEEICEAVSVIQRLDPKPGRLYSSEETVYITPDIYVIKVGDKYEILLNEDGLPRLKVNSYYRDVLSGQIEIGETAKGYIKEKLRSAAWLIKSIHQRQRTIYRVTESIVRFQREFFDKGIAHLKPLVLREVAEDIEMHESTVSRVTTNKYVHTPQGIFELKFFFNSAIKSVDGDDLASETVKEFIRNIVKSEEKKKPYSDQEISDMLREKNIKVARRTVAKYREAAGILPSKKRKEPY